MQDLAPYYDRVEPIFRVAGRKEGFPQLPDGVFLEDNSRRQPERAALHRVGEEAGYRRLPKARRATGSLASSVEPAAAGCAGDTGNLTIVPNAVVREITADPQDRPGERRVLRRPAFEAGIPRQARVLVVGASRLESTRLLLNSLAAYPGLRIRAACWATTCSTSST